jgi:hypothetical protein
MKKVTCWAVWVSLLFAGSLLADQKYYYPSVENAIFSVTLPDTWTAEAKEEVLHATPDDESIYLGFWAVNIESLDQVGDALGEIVGELVTDFEIEEEGDVEINGMSVYYIDGFGLDTEGDDVECSLGIFSPDGETFCVILYYGTEAAEELHSEALQGILESIKPE